MFRRPAVVTLALFTLGAAARSGAQGIDMEIADTDTLTVTCPGWLTETLRVTSTRDVWTGAREGSLYWTREVGHEGGYLHREWMACSVPADALRVANRTTLELAGVRCEGAASLPGQPTVPLAETFDLSLVVTPTSGRSRQSNEDGQWLVGGARYTTRSKRRAWSAAVTGGTAEYLGCEAVVSEQRFTQVKRD